VTLPNKLIMNKITTLLLLITTPLLAQIEKGNNYIWGSVSGQNVHNTADNYSANRFSPNLSFNYGKFTKDGLMVGVSLGWNGSISRSRTSLSSTAESSINNNTLQFGVFGRKYFKAIPRLYPYAGAGIRLAVSKNTTTNSNITTLGTDSDKTTNDGWSVSPQFQLGFSYLVSPRISMVLGTTSSVFPIGFYGLEMGLNYSLKPQKSNSKVVVIEQINAKNWLLGAEISLSGSSASRQNTGNSTLNNNGSSTSSGLGLSVGRFVANGLLVGLAANVATSNDAFENTNSQDKSTNLTLGLRPFVKKYLSRNRQLSPYWVAGVSYEQRKTTYQNGNYSNDSKTSIYGLDGGLGLAYFIGKNLILEAGLAHFSYKNYTNTNTDYRNSEIAGGFSFSPRFTLNYVL
jgi:outer membrane protein W